MGTGGAGTGPGSGTGSGSGTGTGGGGAGTGPKDRLMQLDALTVQLRDRTDALDRRLRALYRDVFRPRAT